MESPLARGLLLFALTFLFYLPSLRNGFIWDDDTWVTHNPGVGPGSSLLNIWLGRGVPQYYPLTLSAFWLEMRLWGVHPLGYHLVNIVLHGVSALLLWRLLRALAVPGAWFAAALFAVHPVHVESVAWVTERKNVLSGVFYFCAALAYVRFAGLIQTEDEMKRSRLSSRPGLRLGPRLGWYALMLGLFVCALFSKTVTSTFPAAALLVLWWKRGRIGWRDALPFAPMFAAAGALGSVTAWMEKFKVGARGAEWDFSPVDRVLIAGRALWFYAAKLLWPADLVFIYPRWHIDAHALWQYLFPLGVLGVFAGLWIARKRLGRGALAGVLFFAGTLAPALGFFDVYPMQFSFVADHFQYLASVGVFSLVAAGLAMLYGLEKLPGFSPARRRVALCLGGAALLSLGAKSWSQQAHYRDAETLWQRVLEENSSAWIAHNNYAYELAGRGEIDKAIGHYEEALRLHPGYAPASFNLANTLAKAGRDAEAQRYFERAIDLNPDFSAAHFNLGNLLLRTGRAEAAVAQYRESLRTDGRNPGTRLNLANALSQLKQTDAAASEYAELVRQDPNYADAHTNWGAMLLESGRADEAIPHFERASQLEPQNAGVRHNLEAAYALKRRQGE